STSSGITARGTSTRSPTPGSAWRAPSTRRPVRGAARRSRSITRSVLGAAAPSRRFGSTASSWTAASRNARSAGSSSRPASSRSSGGAARLRPALRGRPREQHAIPSLGLRLSRRVEGRLDERLRLRPVLRERRETGGDAQPTLRIRGIELHAAQALLQLLRPGPAHAAPDAGEHDHEVVAGARRDVALANVLEQEVAGRLNAGVRRLAVA